jgi:DHA3 family macrolide efflux protein-like MFS transporter
MAAISLAGVMLIDVATAAIAIIPLLFVMIPQPRSKQLDEEPSSYWTDLREGFSYVMNWKGLVALIGMAVVIKIALTPAFSLMPLLVYDYFGGTATQFGILEAALGVGIIAGGALLALWGGFKRRIYTSLLGISALGIGLAILGLVPETAFAAAVAIIFMLGMTTPIIDGPILSILQAGVTPDMQGRVFTLLTSLVSITTPLGLIIAGPVSDLMGLQFWFILSGTICFFVGLVLLFVPAIVNIEENRTVEPTSSGA